MTQIIKPKIKAPYRIVKPNLLLFSWWNPWGITFGKRNPEFLRYLLNSSGYFFFNPCSSRIEIMIIKRLKIIQDMISPLRIPISLNPGIYKVKGKSIMIIPKFWGWRINLYGPVLAILTWCLLALMRWYKLNPNKRNPPTKMMSSMQHNNWTLYTSSGLMTNHESYHPFEPHNFKRSQEI